MVMVTIPDAETAKLLKTSKIKVGWIIFRIRRRVTLVNYFRYLGFGNLARDCKEGNRSKTYFKCGNQGYLATRCNNKPQYALCAKLELPAALHKHILSTSKCRAFRKALKNKKLLSDND